MVLRHAPLLRNLDNRDISSITQLQLGCERHIPNTYVVGRTISFLLENKRQFIFARSQTFKRESPVR